MSGRLVPLVSVVIPTRNRRPLLEEAIESVCQQTYTNWELVVVDDCSGDGTWRYMSAIHDARIRPIRLERHSERSAARNRGLAEARGDYVLFLDDDDRLRPRALEILAEALCADESAVAAVGARCYRPAHGRGWRVWHPPLRLKRNAWLDLLFSAWSISQGQALIRRELCVASGGFRPDLAFGEDHELWMRLGRLGPIVCVPDVVLEYRSSIAAPTRPADEREALAAFDRAREEYVAKLSAAERCVARRVLEAHYAFRRSLAAQADQDHRAALRYLFDAVRAAPFLLRSPLSGPPLARSSVRALALAALQAVAVRKVRVGPRRATVERRE